jgi:hypothetical protein
MSPPPPENWKTGFPRRLGAYLGGLAIGLMFLGLFQQATRGLRTPRNSPAGMVQPAPTPPADAVSPTGDAAKGAGDNKDAEQKPAADKPGTPSPSGTTGGG